MKTSSGQQVGTVRAPNELFKIKMVNVKKSPAVHSRFHISLFVSAGLAVDYFNERLYWADAKLSVIGSVRLDGSDPVIAVSGIKNR